MNRHEEMAGRDNADIVWHEVLRLFRVIVHK